MLTNQILPVVVGAVTQQIANQVLPQMGPSAGSTGSFGGQGMGNGNRALMGQSGATGPDGFQMPKFCSTGSKNRSTFAQELNNDPDLTNRLIKLCVREVGDYGNDSMVALYESLFNRSQAENHSIKQSMSNGYYEPINKGTVDSVSTTSSAYQACQNALQTALGGSNKLGCRRHNASSPEAARSFGADPNSIIEVGTGPGRKETFYSKPGEKCSENFC
jgi:hypothetical protein